MDIPLSLYIHIPWCVKKCPYCDFNSHKKDSVFNESVYIDALIDDLTEKLPLIWGRNISSIFIGGGTPSLFSPDAYSILFSKIRNLLPFSSGDGGIEITMEANPGTIEHGSFVGYKQAGINRISLGVQSFQDLYLKRLGRVHSSDRAVDSINQIKDAGFKNFNIDIMYGLPDQSVDDAIFDIKKAMELSPSHISWYQLTIEPNTIFYKHRPILPEDNNIIEMENIGKSILEDNGFHQYEISAYARDKNLCQHNINYWKFGDYLGIGAGAHSKITRPNLASSSCKGYIIERFNQYKVPASYIKNSLKSVSKVELSASDIIFEFALNRFRLCDGFSLSEFESSTGVNCDMLEDYINGALSKGLITKDKGVLKKTPLGSKFTNDLVEIFLG